MPQIFFSKKQPQSDPTCRALGFMLVSNIYDICHTYASSRITYMLFCCWETYFKTVLSFSICWSYSKCFVSVCRNEIMGFCYVLHSRWTFRIYKDIYYSKYWITGYKVLEENLHEVRIVLVFISHTEICPIHKKSCLGFWHPVKNYCRALCNSWRVLWN